MDFHFSHQLLKGVTIASGGVLPNIHPELLKKRKGGKLVSPEELKPKKPKTTSAPKAVTSGKKIATPTKKASPAKKAPISAGKGKKKGVSSRIGMECAQQSILYFVLGGIVAYIDCWVSCCEPCRDEAVSFTSLCRMKQKLLSVKNFCLLVLTIY